jgi:hypothetical protein
VKEEEAVWGKGIGEGVEYDHGEKINDDIVKQA